jgi:predicted membrane protein (TIGR00267 family)
MRLRDYSSYYRVEDLGKRIIEDITRKLHRIPSYLGQIVDNVIHDEYARRAFANNAFDGALTFLGILMGNLVLDEFHPVTVIYIGLSTCLAIGMSGAFGRFLSEWSERKRSLRQMEKDLFTDLSDTSIERKGREKIIMISLIDGISPALAAVIPLAPFFLAQASIIPVSVSIVASVALVFIVLFGLGMFLGKTSEENVFVYGGMTVAVGFITSLIILSVSIYFH